MMAPQQPGPSYKVAVLVDNFGPYHLARLSGAGRVMEVLEGMPIDMIDPHDKTPE